MALSLISVLLLILAIISLWKFRIDFQTVLMGDETKGSRHADIFLREIGIMLGGFVIIAFLYLYQICKRSKLTSRIAVLFVSFVLAFIFDLVIVIAFLSAMLKLDILSYDLYLFEIMLINIFIFALGSVISVEDILKLEKEEKPLGITVTRIILSNLKRILLLTIPGILMIVGLSLFAEVPGRYITLEVVVCSLIALYSGSIVIFQMNLAFDNIFRFYKARHEI